MRNRSATLLLLLLWTACGGSNPSVDAGAPDAASPDAAAPFLPGWNGQFCAAGAEVVGSNGNVTGTYCLGPLDLAAHPATSPSGTRWEPGPIFVVSP